MKVYSIFDDFDEEAALTLRKAGLELVIRPKGISRPNDVEMWDILETYDCVIIGTSQKISEDMFANIRSPRIIATASIGIDHISVPKDKRELVQIYNAPTANIQSVAEFTMGCALTCCKRLIEGDLLYGQGKNNKFLSKKPGDLAGKTIGVVGAGRVSARIMQYAKFFDMNILCWTPHPQNHMQLADLGVQFTSLPQLVKDSDVISVNLPNNSDTKGLISKELILNMKEDAIFISISRLEVVELETLIQKAEKTPNFYVCLDIDVDSRVCERIPRISNILLTPHIAGGTEESRKRMFREVAGRIIGKK